jgi:saccharopine dehydrogenase (NAD+, L-lysine-forming)
MTSIEPVKFNGVDIYTITISKSPFTRSSVPWSKDKGKTCIGCICRGVKNGKELEYYVYNICDHEECYREVKSQAISYTTGVPAMIGAMMILKGIWKGEGVFNVEEFNPDPFMEALNKYGLPWKEIFR